MRSLRGPAPAPGRRTLIRNLRELRVACILDDISRACFGPECELITFSPDDWRERLSARRPDVLFVESAWQGNGGAWQYHVGTYAHPHYAGLPALRPLLEWCREQAIPTVFWNKEDPVHFDKFAEAAALFEFVLTTDANCIERYQALGSDILRSVQALPFAAQPRLQNPITSLSARDPAPVFAGTYYRNRHVDRRRSIEMLLDAARDFGLIIYDRTFGTESPEFGFPERFLPHIKGRLPYDRVLEVYKSHLLFLNVNSVADSPTMFSRRVFELLACETAVISTESEGVERIFEGLVPIVTEEGEARAEIERLLNDDQYRARLVRGGRRLVMREHTYRHRLLQIAEIAEIQVQEPIQDPVTVVVALDNEDLEENFGALQRDVARQSLLPDQLLVGVPEDAEAVPDEDGPIKVRFVPQDPSAPRSERVRQLAALATSPWLLIAAPGLPLDIHAVEDAWNVTLYADVDVVGAALEDPGDRPNGPHFAQAVDPSLALARSDFVATRGWPEDAAIARDAMPRWALEGIRLIAVPPAPASAGADNTLTGSRQQPA